jgi:hypothetical protein
MMLMVKSKAQPPTSTVHNLSSTCTTTRRYQTAARSQRSSYKTKVAAGAVYKMLGAKYIGVTNDYTKEYMPPVNTGLPNGQKAEACRKVAEGCFQYH